MNAAQRNAKIRRAYGISSVIYLPKESKPFVSVYQITLKDGEQFNVKVASTGTTESSIMRAAIEKLKDRPVNYVP